MICTVCPSCGCAFDQPIEPRAIPVQPDELRRSLDARMRTVKTANDALLANLRAPSRFAVPLGDLR